MRITITLPEKLLYDLKEISAKTELPIAVLVRRGIREIIRIEKIKSEKKVDKGKTGT